MAGKDKFDLPAFWQSEKEEHLKAASDCFDFLQADFTRLLAACATCIRGGGKILFFGNGGSASDAQHLATELTIRYTADRPAIAAIALTTDTSSLTAAGNDLGFERIFSRQVEALGRKGDVAIGISTSGNSANVLKALQTAKALGLVTAGLSGRDGGKMTESCDILLTVPSPTTARIQEMHITIGHMLCDALQRELGLV